MTRRDVPRVRSGGESGNLSYLIFLGRLGLAGVSSGLWVTSCCEVEASISIVSNSLMLIWLEDNGWRGVCRDFAISPLPGRCPASVIGVCWQASFVFPGGSVTSGNERSYAPSGVPVQCSWGCGLPAPRPESNPWGKCSVQGYAGVHIVVVTLHYTLEEV